MGLSKRIGKKSGWMAVKVHPKKVDVAHIQRLGIGKPEITQCDSYEVTDDAALLKLSNNLRLRNYRCSTLLNSQEYQMLAIDAGNAPLSELKAAARWRIKDMLDYPAEQAVVDVFDVPADKNNISRTPSVYAVSARYSTIQEKIQRFQTARVPVSVIDIPEMAQRNLAALFESPDRGLALLTFDDSGGLLTFTAGKEFYLSRRIDAPPSELVGPDSEMRSRHFERVGLELQRSIDNFDRQYSYIALAKLLLAPSYDDLKEYLSSNLDLPVQALDLTTVIDFPKVPELREPQRQAQCLGIIGAALREEAA